MAAAGRKRAAGMLSSPPLVIYLRGGVGRDSDQCNVVSDLDSDLGIIRGNDELLPEGFLDPLPPAKSSNASPAAGPSTSVPAVERVKEAAIPVDESDEYWWDNNAQIFSMRYNKKVRYFPDQPVSEIPTAVLEGLFIPEDKENLEKYNEEELANLQAHLAFSSALVSKYIFDQSSAKDGALEEKENDTKQLRQVTAELQVKVKTLEKELITEKKKMKAKSMAHKEEIDNLNAKKLSAVNELDRLRNEHASQMKNAEEVEMKLEIEMTSWKSEKEDLLARIAALKKQQKEDALDESLRLDDPAIIESEAAILAVTAKGEGPVRPAAKAVLRLIGSSSQPLPEATYNTVPVADLRLLIKQVLREELTNGLPLESFGKNMNEFAQRSEGNQGDMVEIYNILAGFQQRIEKLEETTTMHKQEVPSRVLEALFSFPDQQFLGEYTDTELADLQANVAFSAAMISWHVSGRHTAAREAFAASQATIVDLKKQLDSKEVEAASLKGELAHKEEEVQREKEKRKAEGDNLGLQLESLKKELLAKATEVAALQEQKVADEASRNKREGELQDQVKTLLDQMKTASELPPAPAPSVEAIIEEYKESDAFGEIVTGFGYHAFTVLKKALIKDGCLDPSTAELYTYEICAERDQKGELD